jgi:hypothetical protein
MGKWFLWGGWVVCLLVLALGGFIIDKMGKKIHHQAHLMKLLADQELPTTLSEVAFVAPLRGTGPWGNASGRLFLGANDSRLVLLAAKNLEPLPPPQIYKLWIISDGEPLLAGTLVPNEMGNAFLNVTLPDPLGDVQAATVTAESQDTTTAKAGSIVMAGQF